MNTPGQSGSVSLGSLLISPGSLCTKFCLYPPRVYFPVLCKFCHLYGGVNGDLLQEGLCHAQVCCSQSPCPCGSPLRTRTSTGYTQTQFCLSLLRFPGSWCVQGLFEPSERLWREWGLILNVNPPLLPSCWGFSFDFGHRVSPHSGVTSLIKSQFYHSYYRNMHMCMHACTLLPSDQVVRFK